MTNQWLSFRWQRGTRYYEAHLKKDLFGWIVVRYWGAVGQAFGQRHTTPVNSYSDGLLKLDSIEKIRLKRKYHSCSILNATVH